MKILLFIIIILINTMARPVFVHAGFPHHVKEWEDVYGEGLLEVIPIGNERYLVEVQSEYSIYPGVYNNVFKVYDFNEGGLQIMPLTDLYLVELKEIIDCNHLVFLASGLTHHSPFAEFPFLLHLLFTGERYKAFIEEKTFPLGETLAVTGVVRPTRLEAFIVTVTGLEIICGPCPDSEDEFYAAYVDIPPLTISFPAERVMVIEFIGAVTEAAAVDTGVSAYIDTLKVVEDGGTVRLVLALTEAVTGYRVQKGVLPSNAAAEKAYFRMEFKSNSNRAPLWLIKRR